MATITNIYPSLADVVNFDVLPKRLEFLGEFLITRARKIYLKDLYVGSASDLSFGNYRAALVTYGEVDFPINGDLAFVIAPPTGDDFILRFDYKWEVLRFLSKLDLDVSGKEIGELISSSIPEILEMVLELSGSSASSLIKKVLNVFLSDFEDGIESLMTAYNLHYSTSHTVLDGPDVTLRQKEAYFVQQIIGDGNSIKDVLFDLVIDHADPEEKLARLKHLFSNLFQGVLNELSEIVTPRIFVDIQMPSIGIRFPKSWLTPVDELGNELPDSDAYLTCDDIGGITYEFNKGFSFSAFEDVTYNLPLCKIGNSGLILSATGIKLDLRENSNIPEATADGRPNSFKGVYIDNATITFPNYFTPDDDNATIIARNLLVGSEGGLSGTLGLKSVVEEDEAKRVYLNFVVTDGISGFTFSPGVNEVAIIGHKKVLDGVTIIDEETEFSLHIPPTGKTIIDAENNHFNVAADGTVTAGTSPSGILQFTLFDNTVSIEEFYITFSKNKVVSSTVAGTITIPELDAPLNMEIDFTDGFRIHVSYPDGIDVLDNSVFTLTLTDLELGRVSEKFFLGIAGSLVNKLEIPFVEKFVPETIVFNPVKWTQTEGFDYNLILNWNNGLSIGINNDSGSPQIEETRFRIPFNQQKEDGLFKLDAIDLTLKPVESGITAEARLQGATINFNNVFILTIDGLGTEATITHDEETGNIRPFDVGFGLIPPTGIGIAINAKAIKGGGYLYLDFDEGRYVGVGQLNIKDKVDLTVIGIITTKLPSGEKKKSVLLMVSAEFEPIQLSFGFTLNGVGGLVGINRTMDLQALRDGVKTKAIDNILFPEDPVASINEIVTDLETVFPIQEGRYTFGLMGLIGWGTPTLIDIELGLMLEVPNPVRLAILGVVKSKLPTDENALLKLQVNFVGTIDFEKKLITFDASIYESSFVKFSLAGDMAFRMKWGNDSNFLLSVGGFHPAYTPPPLNLPDMKRLTINLLGEDNPRLSLSTYFAVTSNTVQVGALLDFYSSVTKNIEVLGVLGFDVLIQFSPFYLKAELYAMLSVVRKGNALMSVALYGMLEGPAPWHVVGKAEFVVAKLKLKANFDKTFGEEEHTTLPDVEVMPLLEEEANKNSNWEGVFPESSNLMVSLRRNNNAEGLILNHPNVSLRFQQKVVPLDTPINKFGKKLPADFNRFSIELLDADFVPFETSVTQESFPPAEYMELSDTEKLTRASFEKMNAGLEIQGLDDYQSADVLTIPAAYEHVIMDTVETPEPAGTVAVYTAGFSAWLNNGASAKSTLGTRKKPTSNYQPNKAVVSKESFAIANLDDLTVATELDEPLVYGSEAEARFALKGMIINDPTLEDVLDVVLEHELVA